MMTGLHQRLVDIETLLLRHAALWQPAPFYCIPEWTTAHPDLYNALLALPDSHVNTLEHDLDSLANWLGAYVPELHAIPSLVALPRQNSTCHKPWPVGFEWDIPGRKWTQIEAFAAALHPRAPKIVDWCAGKGHLSRSVAFQHEHPVLALEWNAALCEAGRVLNTRYFLRLCSPPSMTVSLQCQDVLASDAACHISMDSHCIALHACGKLHLRLMEAVHQQHAGALSFSPCCYHLIDTPSYSPMSQIDISLIPHRLILSRNLLRLAVQETVTANGHARRLRDRKSAWRLGFKRWAESQLSEPLPALPSLPDRCFHGSFDDFCRHQSQHLALPLATDVDYTPFENEGWAEYMRVQRFELVRHAFRRALEIWLCLDRACWLEQNGYDVSVSEFCDPHVTPRNILIEAVSRRLGDPTRM